MKSLFRVFAALLLTACSLTAAPSFHPLKNVYLDGADNQLLSGQTFTFKSTSNVVFESGVNFTGLPTTDPTLTAIANLTTAANKITLWTGTDTAAVIDFTALAQTFAGYTTAAQYRNAIFPASPAEGDSISHDGTNWIRIPIGTTGQVPVVQVDGTWAWDDFAVTVDAEDVVYDPAVSGLTATDVQAAIDELDTALDAVQDTGLFVGRSAKTSAYTVVAGDKGYLIDCTSGTFSISFTAAATLTAGFHVAVYNSGSGTITLDPNSSETIRDPSGSATTKTLAQGTGMIIVCDGSGFLAVATASAGGGGGSGDVVGPSSSTNNRLAIFDSTSGKLLKDSSSIIAASGLLTFPTGAGGPSGGGDKINFYGGNANYAMGVESFYTWINGEHGLKVYGAGGLVATMMFNTITFEPTTASTSTATGAFVNKGGFGNDGVIYTQHPVVARTTALSVAANQSNATFTNEGATAQVVFSLPTAAANLKYTFIVQDADGLRVTGASGDTLRIAGSVSGAAGYVEAATIGNTVTIQCINTTEWIATSVNGTWTVSP